MTEDLLLNETDNGLAVIFAGAAFENGTIGIWERDVRHAGHERVEAAVIVGFARCKGDRPHGPPMECAEETDEVVTLGMKLRQFDRGLNRFCPGVCQERPCALFEG